MNYVSGNYRQLLHDHLLISKRYKKFMLYTKISRGKKDKTQKKITSNKQAKKKKNSQNQSELKIKVF